MSRSRALVAKAALLLCLLCALSAVHGKDDDYDYDDYNFSTDKSSSSKDKDNDYNYYSDDNQDFYNDYGYYPDDDDAYDSYDDYNAFDDCTVNSKGKPVVSNDTVACPIKIQGVDKQAPKLSGGIDGIYELAACFNGKPMYRRKNTTKQGGQSRVLWYSDTFTDWDISNGTEPNESAILMYGGEKEHAGIPLLVSNWHLGASLTKNTSLKGGDYVPVKPKMVCADGTKIDLAKLKKKSAAQLTTGPMLTNDEFDKKYNEIYERFGKRPEPNPTVNFTFVVLLVMIGLTIVLAIPYFLMKKKGGTKASISTSFTQMLQQSKKKQSGHAV